MNGRPAAERGAWMAEATTRGLIDPKAKTDSARALLSKYRRELIAANRIACNDELCWVLR